MKHYEFVPGDTIEVEPGKVLHRIRATTHIEDHGVKPGDLGGYIETHKNLGGQAWVYDNAQVFGNAMVSGGARVSGNAWIYGDALIFWASKVGSENGTLTVYNTQSNGLEVACGRFRGSVEEFLAMSKAKHDSEVHRECQLLIEVATARIARARERLGDSA